ncbi:MAG TPA: lytic transglycosylase domain-containing protein, partial [Thermoanaerobaculia bacterium]|nr:lytic transglycosylase domain-containing protein [Thermoanaerobaculia bacterium]
MEIKPLDPSLFPVPDSLLSNVNFWTDIFARYSSHQVVLHDELVPQRIYRLLDFTSLDNAITSDVLKKRRREAVVKQGLAEVGGLLRKLAAGDAAALESEEGQRVTALFGGSPTRGELLAAAQNLRAQPGLSDIFAGAITRAGRYLPHLEEIFRGYGLPVELTRLPFIESMFQLNARSKVSAGGMWQIMPATGRRFLRVGREVDERFDPLSAGTAAAQILTENYQMLGSWPLALTAYNHGPYGVARAVSQLGTRDIGTICAAWKGKAFGFASRNFYAEFVAAATLFENREHFFPGVALAPPLAFDEFVPDRYVHARDLAREAKANVTDLADLNPAVADEIW